jgi:hypothetical protein
MHNLLSYLFIYYLLLFIYYHIYNFVNILRTFLIIIVILYYIPLAYSLLSNLLTNMHTYCIQCVWLLESVHLKPDDDKIVVETCSYIDKHK